MVRQLILFNIVEMEVLGQIETAAGLVVAHYTHVTLDDISIVQVNVLKTTAVVTGRSPRAVARHIAHHIQVGT